MKLKSLLKVGLPILGVAALSVSLPLALTSCSEDSSSDNEVNTTKEGVQLAAKKIADLSTKNIGTTKNVVTAESIANIITSEMGVGKNTIETFDIAPTATKLDDAEAEQPTVVDKDWTITITLNGENKFDKNIASTTLEAYSQENADDEAAGVHVFNATVSEDQKTLTLIVDGTKFEKIEISKDIVKKDVLSKALESIATQRTQSGSTTNVKFTGEQFKEILIEQTSEFIPSSIKEVSLTGKLVQPNPASFFAVTSDVETSKSTIQTSNYEVNATFQLNESFVIDGDGLYAYTSATITGINYQDVSISLTQVAAQKIADKINSVYSTFTTENAEDALNKLKTEIKSVQVGSLNNFWNYLVDIKAGEISSNTTTLELVFEGNVVITIQESAVALDGNSDSECDCNSTNPVVLSTGQNENVLNANNVTFKKA